MRKLGRVAFAILFLAAACSSSSKSSGPPPQEIGRGDVGPGGGTVTAGPVTIQVPAGALTESKTIIVSKIDPANAKLPTGTALANDLYLLEPDDVTFAQPVTVTITLDPSKKRADGKGAVVLFRAAAGTTSWAPQGANDPTATTLVGTTTHFSNWAPTTAQETSCFLNICSPLPPPDLSGGDPAKRTGPPISTDRSLGLNCNVPSDTATAGVHCFGTGPDNGSPYQCECIGTTQILGTWELVPADTTITAMAAQCGAQCPTTCDLEIVCSPPTPGQPETCTSQLTPTVTCTSPDNNNWTCSCGSESLTYAGANPSNNPDLFPMWQKCGGSCNDIDGGSWVCPPTAQFADPDGGPGCIVETTETCRDNHYYGFSCDQTTGPNDPPTTCHCMMDGKPTKDVSASCFTAYQPCGIPKVYGL